MLLQMIVGAWPANVRPDDAAGIQIFRERLACWQSKALREAKLLTSWDAPDTVYRRRRPRRLLDAILTGAALADLRVEITTVLDGLMPAAICNGLTQTVLRLCTPGVPDVYQGAELQELTLVDPDNRRPVDYARRARLLAQDAGHGRGPRCVEATRHRDTVALPA